MKPCPFRTKTLKHNSIQNSVLHNVMNIEVHILARQQQIKRYTNHQPEQAANLPGTVILLLLHLTFWQKTSGINFHSTARSSRPQSHLQSFFFLSFLGSQLCNCCFFLCCFCYYQLHCCWSIITITIGTYLFTYLPTTTYLLTYLFTSTYLLTTDVWCFFVE